MDVSGWALLLALVALTSFWYPVEAMAGAPTVWVVFYYGWVSAVTTGLGALPFCIFRELSETYKGISNGLTAGMMLAATISLVVEGYQFDEDNHLTLLSPLLRVAFGLVAGVLFVYTTSEYLKQYEDLAESILKGMSTYPSAQKVILFMLVMTVHSFSEGVSIGVSFGGSKGAQLGQFISLSLAVHNIPEGLAAAVKMSEFKFSNVQLILWAIFTSIPQPTMAVPAFLFVEAFIPWLPVGLGFAGGAMFWVAVKELIPEAVQQAGIITTAASGIGAATIMLAMQSIFR